MMRGRADRSGLYSESEDSGSYLVTVTFDIEGGNPGGSLYESIGKELSARGLRDQLDSTLTGGGQPDKMPNNTYVGLMSGSSADEVLNDVLGATVSAFKAHGQHGSILGVAGGPDYGARTFSVRN
jgi:hypothetical protein